MKKCNFALIGYGGMGKWHTELLADVEELNLKGVYDILPERNELAVKNGLFAYDSFEAVLADKEVEVLIVAIPNDLHKDVCITAMKAGKNVICEKPVCLNSGELKEMIKAGEDNNVLFTVHQNRRWDEDYLTVKKMLEENTLGKVFNIESRVHGSRGIPGDWRNTKKQGGGMVLDWGVHLLDQIYMMMGELPKSVYAKLSNVTNEEVDDGFTSILTFKDDLTVLVEVGTSNFISLPRWYIQGENGSAVIENFQLDGKIVMVSDWEKRDAVPVATAAGLTKTMAPRTSDTIKEYPLPIVKANVRDYYRNVVKAVNGEEKALIKTNEVADVMRLMEALFKSSELDQVVTL